MEYKTVQKYVLTSPKKLREVSVLIRKMEPREAIDKLPFVGKKASEPLRKVIMTALANAKVQNASEDTLILKEIQITDGPRLKRFRAGARGRAKPYRRKMSHIRVVLATRKPEILNPKSEKKSNDPNSKIETKNIINETHKKKAK